MKLKQLLKIVPVLLSMVLTAGAGAGDLKITVAEKGVYKVTYDAMVTAGWDLTSLDPDRFQLSSNGVEVSIRVSGDDDHSFDKGDYFIFYGEPLESDMTHSNADNLFVLDNVYWLTAEGQNPSRMQESNRRLLSDEPITEFEETIRFQQDEFTRTCHIDDYMWASFPDYEDEERSDAASKAFDLDLPGLNNQKTAFIKVRLQGQNNDPEVDPDHHVKITVNSAFTDDGTFDGHSVFLFESEIDSGVLQDGLNTLTVQNMLDLGTGEDLFRLDWIEVQYQRNITAKNNEMFFSIDRTGGFTVEADGFEASALLVLDITEPAQAVFLGGTEVVSGGSGYAVKFSDEAEAVKHYAVIAESALKTPASIERYQTTGLEDTQNRADYIMITHGDFYDALQTLADYRQDEGYEVKVVKIQDIYNDFNHGIMHPQAIKNFLAYAYRSWTPPAPAYVLLVGDGSCDATDRLGLGNHNFIPIMLENFGSGSGPNDTWYAQVEGDDVLADMFIGRLPVQNSDQLESIIDRIIEYEISAKAEWMHKAFFIAGDDPYFVFMNEQIAQDGLPFNYKSFYYNDGEQNDITEIFERLEKGKALTVFAGHGNVTSWNGILNASALEGLIPAGKPTFLITLECFNGHFAHPLDEGLAEEFLRHEGGALACFSPSSASYAFEHQVIADNLFSLLFEDNETILGKLTQQAKDDAQEQGWLIEGTYDQYLFLGDPATRFKICKFYLVAPADRSSITRSDSFQWVADGYSRFVIQFSRTPDFQTGQTLTLRTRQTAYSPGMLAWSIIRNMGQNGRVVWWRVGGLTDAIRRGEFSSIRSESIPFTEPVSFTIQ